MKKSKKLLSAIVSIGIVIAILAFLIPSNAPCEHRVRHASNNQSSGQTAFAGNADDKLEIPEFCNEETDIQLIEHYAITIGYNKGWKIPRWVAYELLEEELNGDVPRKKHFDCDPELDIEVSAVDYDYRNSGYDRGHMAPAADMKFSEQAMEESFYFSNVCPQNPNLNRGDWNDLEEQVRHWAREFGKVYIACGPIVTSSKPATIGKANVVVPDAFFKVVLAESEQGWQAIGFVMKNEAGNRPLSTYAMSVDEVEKMTQLDFFAALDDKVENKIEACFDLKDWNIKPGK